MTPKQTIKLNENDLRKVVRECVKKALSESPIHRYKGFKCVNASDNPSFPNYDIVSPNGEVIDSTLFPSDFKDIVDDYLHQNQHISSLNEGESYGWVVDSSEAEEAYNMFAAEIGNEEANAAIVRAMSNNVLADILAYLFRMYDFRQWNEREVNVD